MFVVTLEASAGSQRSRGSIDRGPLPDIPTRNQQPVIDVNYLTKVIKGVMLMVGDNTLQQTKARLCKTASSDKFIPPESLMKSSPIKPARRRFTSYDPELSRYSEPMPRYQMLTTPSGSNLQRYTTTLVQLQ